MEHELESQLLRVYYHLVEQDGSCIYCTKFEYGTTMSYTRDYVDSLGGAIDLVISDAAALDTYKVALSFMVNQQQVYHALQGLKLYNRDVFLHIMHMDRNHVDKFLASALDQILKEG